MSRYQSVKSLGRARNAGLKFIIIKATQGTEIKDPAFVGHLAAARAAGLLVGGYHFFDYTADGTAQADHFIDVLAANGVLDGSLAPAFDLECSRSLGSVDQAVVVTQLRAFVERVYARVGRYPILYTSRAMWKEITKADKDFGGLPLWVACWRCRTPLLPAGWTDYAFLQFGPTKVPGYTKKVDGNIFHGTDAGLELMRGRPMVIEGGAQYAIDPDLTLDLSGLDGADVRYSADGGNTWTDWANATDNGTFAIAAVNGEHLVSVQLRDKRLGLGPILSDSIVFDGTPPDLTATQPGLRTARIPKSGRVPIRSTWAASDAFSGLNHAELRLTCGSRRSTLIADETALLGTSEPTPIDSRITAGATCRIDATASDVAGNASVASPRPFRVDVVQRSAPGTKLVYKGKWRTRSVGGALGGKVRSTTRPGSRVTLTFRGSDIGIVSTLGPDHGRVRVLLDGASLGSVDLYAPKQVAGRVVWTHHVSGPGPHTLQVQVLGTHNAASTGNRFDLDAFLVLGKP